jgi:uncharacterized SAM-binding protein YcdF (DUF218 family)
MYSFLVEFLQPYGLLYLLTGMALLRLWRHRRETPRRLMVLSVAFLALTALSIPAVAHLAVGTLEWQYPPEERRPDDTTIIVVLACGVLPPDATRERAELDADTLRRCRHAAALYHRGPRLVVLSGGAVSAETPACARLMYDLMIELGVRASDLIMEDRSTTTHENAVECSKLLFARGTDRAVLVADAVDMFRAVRCFRKQGVEVVPSASHYRATQFHGRFFEFVPSPNAARNCQRVWHEWLGVAWYALRGRI